MPDYYVVCFDDSPDPQLVFARSRPFRTREEAETYRQTVAHQRAPRILVDDRTSSALANVIAARVRPSKTP